MIKIEKILLLQKFNTEYEVIITVNMKAKKTIMSRVSSSESKGYGEVQDFFFSKYRKP